MRSPGITSRSMPRSTAWSPNCLGRPRTRINGTAGPVEGRGPALSSAESPESTGSMRMGVMTSGEGPQATIAREPADCADALQLDRLDEADR